jgi:hypothetical protein
MYAEGNPKTKKALREMVELAARIERGARALTYEQAHAYYPAAFQPGPFGPTVADGLHTCEGPHYPAPHRWYARVRVRGGRIVKVEG